MRALGWVAWWSSCLVLGLAPAETATPERIASLSPSVTEILDGVEAFDRVIAVSSYCEYPPEVEALPRVGGWQNTDLEKLTALDPDLVLLTDAQAPLVHAELEALGLTSVVVPSQSIEDVFSAIETIGRAVGRDTEARRLSGGIRRTLDEVRARTSGRPRPRVLSVVDRLPGTLRDLYVATRGSYLTQLVEIAGGDPIMPRAPHHYTTMTLEAVVSLEPEVILDMVQALSKPVTLGGMSHPLAEDPTRVWEQLGSVPAVRDRRVHGFHDKRLVHPSQFIGETAIRIGRVLHPEAFSDVREERPAR